jgi:hypothetical protein
LDRALVRRCLWGQSLPFSCCPSIRPIRRIAHTEDPIMQLGSFSLSLAVKNLEASRQFAA